MLLLALKLFKDPEFDPIETKKKNWSRVVASDQQYTWVFS